MPTMSALGQKQTFAVHKRMSALLSIATANQKRTPKANRGPLADFRQIPPRAAV